MGERFPTALITDWRGTAGPAIAMSLAQAGYSLLINGPQDEVIRLQAVDTLAKTLALPFEPDDEESVQSAIKSCVERLGGLDILVNNNYFWNDASLNDITEDMWDEVINRGFKSTFYCSRAAAQVMQAQQFGKIINIVGTSVFTGVHTQYAASCAAVHSLTRSMARELAPNIRVNTVAAGLIDEPWIDDGGPELREMLTKDVPLERLCRNEDIAEAVCFLACGADFMTGQMLVLDGGETVR